MKTFNLLFALCFLAFCSFGQNIQNPLEDQLTIYPIRYENGMEAFLTLEYWEEGLTLKFQKKGSDEAFEEIISQDHILLKDLDPEADYELSLFRQTEGKKELLNESPIIFNSHFDDMIEVGTTLNRKMNQYVTDSTQSIPVNEYLLSLVDEKTIYKEEVLSFAQQYYFDWNQTISRDKNAFDSIFENYQKGEKSAAGPCLCKFVLNHNRVANPNNNPPNTSNGVTTPVMDFFSDNSPEYHAIYKIEKGPAHWKYLAMEGRRGAHRFQYSDLGVDNPDHPGAPSYATMNYNLHCYNYSLVPKDCGCIKFIHLNYRYDLKMQLHTPDLNYFWSDGREAGVEEFAVLTANSAFGTHVLDAGRAKIHNSCNSAWNLDWFSSLANLAVNTATLVTGIINQQGGTISNVNAVINDILTLASTPVVTVTGSCTDQLQNATLIEGQTYYVLRPNEPTSFILTSYSYLGGRGYGKWRLWAASVSDYAMSSVILSGAITGWWNGEDAPWCCTDKLGQYNIGSVGGAPLSENNLKDDVASHIGLLAPWDNVTYNSGSGLLQLPYQNLGAFAFNDPNDDCAITIPSVKKKEYKDPVELNNDPIDLSQIPSNGNEESLNNPVVIQEELSLTLFPNPAESILNIRITVPENETMEIVVFNVYGKKVATPFIGQLPAGETTLPWNPGTKISSGTYVVSCIVDGAVLSSQKFIKK